MVTQIILQTIDPEKRDEYIQKYKDEWKIANLPSNQGGEILRAVEKPDRVILILKWDSIESHRAANRTPAHDRLMAEATDKYRAGPSDYAHYEVEEI